MPLYSTSRTRTTSARRGPRVCRREPSISGTCFVTRQAISDRNYPVIQGGILFVAVVVVFVNLLVDISYGLINPRIRLGGK